MLTTDSVLEIICCRSSASNPKIRRIPPTPSDIITQRNKHVFFQCLSSTNIGMCALTSVKYTVFLTNIWVLFLFSPNTDYCALKLQTIISDHHGPPRLTSLWHFIREPRFNFRNQDALICFDRWYVIWGIIIEILSLLNSPLGTPVTQFSSPSLHSVSYLQSNEDLLSKYSLILLDLCIYDNILLKLLSRISTDYWILNTIRMGNLSHDQSLGDLRSHHLFFQGLKYHSICFCVQLCSRTVLY